MVRYLSFICLFISLTCFAQVIGGDVNPSDKSDVGLSNSNKSNENSCKILIENCHKSMSRIKNKYFKDNKLEFNEVLPNLITLLTYKSLELDKVKLDGNSGVRINQCVVDDRKEIRIKKKKLLAKLKELEQNITSFELSCPESFKSYSGTEYDIRKSLLDISKLEEILSERK